MFSNHRVLRRIPFKVISIATIVVGFLLTSQPLRLLPDDVKQCNAIQLITESGETQIVKLPPHLSEKLSPPRKYIFARNGHNILVGAASDAANVFSIQPDRNGQYSVKELETSDRAIHDFFGQVFDIDRDYAVVSAMGDDDNGFASGSVYVFDLSDVEKPKKLIASDGQPNDAFGTSVAISHNIIAVGAVGSDEPEKNSGAVYIFERVLDSWVQTKKITASDITEDAFFGASLSVHGRAIIVGAPGAKTKGRLLGAAYIFENTNGKWIEIQKVSNPFDSTDISFATSVAIGAKLIAIASYDTNFFFVHGSKRHVGRFDGEAQTIMRFVRATSKQTTPSIEIHSRVSDIETVGLTRRFENCLEHPIASLESQVKRSKNISE